MRTQDAMVRRVSGVRAPGGAGWTHRASTVQIAFEDLLQRRIQSLIQRFPIFVRDVDCRLCVRNGRDGRDGRYGRDGGDGSDGSDGSDGRG